MWAELHELMDENKHLHGIEFKETVFTFLKKYNISSIQEDGLLKTTSGGGTVSGARRKGL